MEVCDPICVPSDNGMHTFTHVLAYERKNLHNKPTSKLRPSNLLSLPPVSVSQTPLVSGMRDFKSSHRPRKDFSWS